mgnify:CR=1 FL=1
MNYESNCVIYNKNSEENVSKERVVKSIGDCIDKLIMLERKLGNKVSKELIEPESFNIGDSCTDDEAEIVANKLANILGLTTKITINNSSRSIKNAEGNEPNSLYNFFIGSGTHSKDWLLNSLAHDLAHLYLYKNGINLLNKSVLNSRLLIDIAAIYLGLGKLILNGYEHDNSQNSGSNNNLVHTNAQYLGFAYITICNMRGIPKKVYIRNLSTNGSLCISKAMKYNEFSPYLKHNFLNDKYTNKNLAKVKDALYSFQILLSDIEKNLRNDEIRSAREIKPFLAMTHQKLFTYSKIIADFTEGRENLSQPLKYLYSMKIYQAFGEMLLCLNRSYSSAKAYLDYLINIGAGIEWDLTLNNKSNKCIVVCRNDKTKIRHPKGEPPFIATCPKCKYQFVASTDTKLHHVEVKDFISLYEKYLKTTRRSHKPSNQTIKADGLIKSILLYPTLHPCFTLAFLLILIGLTALLGAHFILSLIFLIFATFFIIVDVLTF